MTACDALNKAFGKTISYFSKLEFLKTINIFEVGADYVKLGVGDDTKLYGCKIESDSNNLVSLFSLKSLADDIKYDSNSSQLYIYYVKKDGNQSVFVYSYSLAAIEQLAHEFKGNRFSGRKLIVSLFETFHIGGFSPTDDNRLDYNQIPEVDENYFVPWDMDLISGKFASKIQMAHNALINKGATYQATTIKNRDGFDPVDLFSLSWEGVIAISLDLSPIASKARLLKYEAVAKKGDKKFYKICREVLSEGENAETLEKIEDESCLMNCMAYFPDDKKKDFVRLSSILGVEFEENVLTGPNILAKTLMNARDFDFDMIVPLDRVEKYFSSSHKRPVPKNVFPYWHGRDISGNFVNFSIDVNSSPHAMYVGKTGAGKSRQAIHGLTQILGYNMHTKKALRIDQFNVRYTDVGFTCGNLAMGLEESYPDKVKIFSSRIKDLRFSLFNIEIDGGEIDTDGLDFMANLVSFALDVQDDSAKGGKALSGSEKVFLKKIVKHMIEKGKYSDFFLYEFEEKKVYGKLLQALYDKGYNKKQRISQLSSEYDYLKKPVLADVINEVSIFKGKTEYSLLEKKDLEMLEKKLTSMEAYQFLTFHSNMPASNETFTHIDFDEIKEDIADFCVVYWLMVKSWISIMKSESRIQLRKKLAPKKTLFYVDEAHNFFRHPSFEYLLISSVKEFRKYGGIFFFLSQESEDVSSKVLTQLGTKIFVSAPDEKRMMRNTIEKTFGVMSESDFSVLERNKDYMMHIRSDHGAMGMKFDSDPADDWFYKPNHPDF